MSFVIKCIWHFIHFINLIAILLMLAIISITDIISCPKTQLLMLRSTKQAIWHLERGFWQSREQDTWEILTNCAWNIKK